MLEPKAQAGRGAGARGRGVAWGGQQCGTAAVRQWGRNTRSRAASQSLPLLRCQAPPAAPPTHTCIHTHLSAVNPAPLPANPRSRPCVSLRLPIPSTSPLPPPYAPAPPPNLLCTICANPLPPQVVKFAIDNNMVEVLAANDQLRNQQKKGKVLQVRACRWRQRRRGVPGAAAGRVRAHSCAQLRLTCPAPCQE